jgi:transcriptional regulator with GAF, ATPase, and Fis domain
MIFEGVPAEHGAIVLADIDPAEFKSSISWDRKAGPLQTVQVSHEIVQQVMGERVGVLINDPVIKPPRQGSQSPAPVSSLMCVPLIAPERVLGVIYLDTSDPAVRFDEQHLQLLAAIASISALGLSSLSYVGALISENRRLREDSGLEHEIVGQSARIQKVLHFISKVAPSDSTVLIEGESGTGKELVARAVHRNSPRANKSFVALNCAALPENLIESELFGYEKGAFTGATATKRGQLEAAEGGTLFLDEIGELAVGVQAKLLRVLQEREFMRLGGKGPTKIDVRLIAATNRDLAAATRDGTFRQDLYFRLNVVSVKLPALRERPEDISLLADYFVSRFSQRGKRPVRGISPEARRCLANYDWPGNIRELENALERAVVMGSTELLLPEDLPDAVLESGVDDEVSGMDYHTAVKKFKRELILQAMEESKGNYAEAAKRLALQLTYLYRLVRNLDLKPDFMKFSEEQAGKKHD